MGRHRRFLFVSFVLVSSACSPPAPVPPVTPSSRPTVERERPPTVDLSDAELKPATGVTVMNFHCAPGLGERCDALDEDCDGIIDEGCTYSRSGGAIQVVVAWNSDADLRLDVVGPAGPVPVQAASGCDDTRSLPRIAGADVEQPVAKGTYSVKLRDTGSCDTNGVATTATVSIAVGRKILGVLNRTLQPGESAGIASLTL